MYCNVTLDKLFNLFEPGISNWKIELVSITKIFIPSNDTLPPTYPVRKLEKLVKIYF